MKTGSTLSSSMQTCLFLRERLVWAMRAGFHCGSATPLHIICGLKCPHYRSDRGSSWRIKAAAHHELSLLFLIKNCEPRSRLDLFPVLCIVLYARILKFNYLSVEQARRMIFFDFAGASAQAGKTSSKKRGSLHRICHHGRCFSSWSLFLLMVVVSTRGCCFYSWLLFLLVVVEVAHPPRLDVCLLFYSMSTVRMALHFITRSFLNSLFLDPTSGGGGQNETI